MKIYSKVVIDIESGDTLYEDSCEYTGEVAECKSGGAGGGGGSSGAVDFPQYMKDVHQNWLANWTSSSKDKVSMSVTKLMDAAMQGTSPYYGFEGISIDDTFLGQNVPITAYIGPYARLKDFGCFNIEAKYDEYISDDNAKMTAFIAAESEILNDQIYEDILPKFKAGMDDINAVQSTSFIIGEALIWSAKAKQLAKSDAAIRLDRLNSQSEIALRRIATYTEWSRLMIVLSTELARIYASSRHDMDSLKTELKAKDVLFDLSVYQYGVNVMSSISGSAVSPPDPGSGKSGGSAALSGAATGASLGASTGSGWGTVIGGVIGLAAGLYSDHRNN